MKCTINDIANVISESIPNPAESGYDIFVGLEHYDSGEVKITRYGSTDSLVTAVKVFKKGDILLARRNVYLKRAGLVDFDGVTSGDSIVLRVKPDLSKLGTRSSSVQKYLPFVLNTEEFWNYAEKYSDGTMSKRLSPKTLLQYEFEIPDDVDNKKDLLWSAFETKESYRTMIKAIDEMVKSQFIEMFRSVPRRTVKLSEIATYTIGLTYKPENVKSAGIPVLRSGNIQEESLDLNDLVRVDLTIPETLYLRDGDVLMCSRNGSAHLVGKVARIRKLSEPMTFGAFMTVIRSEYMDYLYLFFQSSEFRKQISYGKSSTMNQITQKMLDQIVLDLPCQDDIKKLTPLLKSSDKSKFELKQAIEKIDKVMRSLMQ